MKRSVWLVLLLAGCAAAPSTQAPVVERLPQPKKQAPAPKPAPAAKAPMPATGMPSTTEKDWRPDSYVVKKGDTLYSIGLEFGFDYKEIAQWNSINPPYVIYAGQSLKLKNGAAPAPSAQPQQSEQNGVVVTPMKAEPTVAPKPLGGPPLKTEPKALKEPYSEQAMSAPLPKPAESAKPVEPAKAETAKPEAPKAEIAKAAEPEKPAATAEKPAAPGDDEAVDWGWPAQGKVLAGFNESGGSKGLDIGGNQGQPVLAAGAGKVVYSGAGLRGYGKLVIIKHNKTYLSAYAHNSQVLVKEGQEVTKGQKIAEMGSTDADRVKLHFEIRRLGKPTDPGKYLPEKP